MGSDAEVRWLYAEGGASMFYPKQWAAFEAAAAALQATPSPAPCQAGSPLSVPAILAAYHGALVPPGVSRAHPAGNRSRMICTTRQHSGIWRRR